MQEQKRPELPTARVDKSDGEKLGRKRKFVYTRNTNFVRIFDGPSYRPNYVNICPSYTNCPGDFKTTAIHIRAKK